LIRALARPGRPPVNRPGRQRRYDPALLRQPLKRVWLGAEQPCAKRLKVVLPQWLPHYNRHFGALDPEVHRLLTEASGLPR